MFAQQPKNEPWLRTRDLPSTLPPPPRRRAARAAHPHVYPSVRPTAESHRFLFCFLPLASPSLPLSLLPIKCGRNSSLIHRFVLKTRIAHIFLLKRKPFSKAGLCSHKLCDSMKRCCTFRPLEYFLRSSFFLLQIPNIQFQQVVRKLDKTVNRRSFLGNNSEITQPEWRHNILPKIIPWLKSDL